MSENLSDEMELVVYSNDDNWNSANSLVNQKILNLSKSETNFSLSLTKLISNITFKELELNEWSHVTEHSNKNWEFDDSDSKVPKLIFTKNHLRDELEILKINLSEKDKLTALIEFQRESNVQKKVHRKFAGSCKKLWGFWKLRQRSKVRDLMTEIEDSEAAKKDATAWKFLKRGSAIRKELFLRDSDIFYGEPIRLTCPNCTFFIITNTKKVSTFKTKIFSFLFAAIGLCVPTFSFYSFKDTVHLCPLCRIYLGFCPAVGKQGFKKKIQSCTSSSDHHT